jgi:DNA replication protein DnaC
LEVLPIAIRGVDPQGIALHEDGEPISTCPVCGEVNKLWANVAFHGKLCPMPSRRDCACVRARNEREKRVKEARARRQSLAAVFSPEVVPVDYEGTKLDGWGDINANIGFLGRRVLKFYDEDNKSTLGAVLAGKTGIGKTRLLYCLVEELLARDVHVRYVSWPQLTTRIKATFSGHGATRQTQASIVDELIDARFLLVDELGFGTSGDWQRELVFTLIEGAIRSRTTLVCATNLNERELRTWLPDPVTRSPRTYNRLVAVSPHMWTNGQDVRLMQERKAYRALLGTEEETSL